MRFRKIGHFLKISPKSVPSDVRTTSNQYRAHRNIDKNRIERTACSRLVCVDRLHGSFRTRIGNQRLSNPGSERNFALRSGFDRDCRFCELHGDRRQGGQGYGESRHAQVRDSLIL